jgi:[ribosomal protein S5]-alanine N-acetyltransferase
MITHIGKQPIETTRLILRKFIYTDNEDMLKYWVSDPAVQSMYSEPVYSTKEEVDELLDKYIGSYKRDDYYRWSIIFRDTSECIGQIAYFLVDNKNHFAEIEYCIGSKFQRNGLGTEATKAVIEYGFNKMSLHKYKYATSLQIYLQKRLLNTKEHCVITFTWTVNI